MQIVKKKFHPTEVSYYISFMPWKNEVKRLNILLFSSSLHFSLGQILVGWMERFAYQTILLLKFLYLYIGMLVNSRRIELLESWTLLKKFNWNGSVFFFKYAIILIWTWPKCVLRNLQNVCCCRRSCRSRQSSRHVNLVSGRDDSLCIV